MADDDGVPDFSKYLEEEDDQADGVEQPNAPAATAGIGEVKCDNSTVSDQMVDVCSLKNDDGLKKSQIEMAKAVVDMLIIPHQIYLPENSERRLLLQGGLMNFCQVESQGKQVDDKEEEEGTNEEGRPQVKKLFTSTRNFFKRKAKALTTNSSGSSEGGNNNNINGTNNSKSTSILFKSVASFVQDVIERNKTEKNNMVQGYLFDDYFVVAQTSATGELIVLFAIDLLNLTIRDLGTGYYHFEEDDNNDDDDNHENNNKIDNMNCMKNMFELVDNSEELKLVFDTAEEHNKRNWFQQTVQAVCGAIIKDRPIRASSKGWKHRIVRGTAWSAAMEGNERQLGLIISSGNSSLLDTPDENGATPLHYACWKGKTLMTKSLIGKGSLLDSMDNDLLTPLHYAALRLSLGPACSLLDSGADPNARDLKDQTPLFLACKQHALHVKTSVDDEEEKYAIEKRTGEFINLLASRDADLDAHDVSGDSMLIVCLKMNNISIATSLLQAGAHVNKLSAKTQESPLMVVCTKDEQPSVALIGKLIMHGADANLRDSNGNTPLHRLLGVSNNDSDKDNNSTLGMCNSEQRDAINFLISYGARVDLGNHQNTTPEQLLKKQGIPYDEPIRKWQARDEPENVAKILVKQNPHRIPFATGPGISNWEEDSQVSKCNSCAQSFGLMHRRHHCRRCGKVFCSMCCFKQVTLKVRGNNNNTSTPSRNRVCTPCFNVLNVTLTIAVKELEPITKTKKEIEENQRSSLFGDRNVNNENEKSMSKEQQVSASGMKTKDILQQTKLDLVKRGEKLNKLADKSAELSNNAEGFSSLAKKLREKEEKKSGWFGDLF